MEKKKILIIDDEEDFLKMVKMNLEESGEFEVLALSTAKDVVYQVNNFNPQVVILDLIMPSVGGLEACEMLNNDSKGQRTPIIILSALGKDIDKLKAYKLGVVDYLVKPIQADALIAAINKCLRYRN
ncbi:MAG: response regulator [Candidatus Omnitrophica bacterium]|nr:response regulator [Candidatus Omnitrophota bacterium]